MSDLDHLYETQSVRTLQKICASFECNLSAQTTFFVILEKSHVIGPNLFIRKFGLI